MQLQLEVPSDSTGNPYHIHLTLPFRLCKPFFSTTCFECQKPRVRLASYLHGCDFAWYPRVAPATHVGQVHPISSCVDPDCTRSCTPNNIRDPEKSDCQKSIFPDCQKYQKSRGIHCFFWLRQQKSLNSWGIPRIRPWPLARALAGGPVVQGQIFFGVDMGWISVAAYKCVGMNLWMHFCWQFIFWHFFVSTYDR